MWTETINIGGVILAAGHIMNDDRLEGKSVIVNKTTIDRFCGMSKKQILDTLTLAAIVADEYSEIHDAFEIRYRDANMSMDESIAHMRKVANKYKSHRGTFYAGLCNQLMSNAERLSVKKPFVKYKPIETGYVYVIRNDKFYKIGKSKKPLERFETLQVASPHKIEHVFRYRIDNTGSHEKSLHALMSSKKISGEWFKLSKNDIAKIETYLAENGGSKHG